MCLLMHKPATATISRELADNIYTSNSDGFGILFAKDNLLYTQKTLGDRDEIWAIINEHQGDEMLLHWRMRTHGDVDLTNCHPYEVYGDGSEMPVYLMHNGVLATGNAKDTSKSDTWHYIRDFIIPVTQNNPAMLFDTPMRTLLAGHIGSSNKFAMMNHLGQVSICNRASGIEWSGLWFSNTYAWSAHKFGAVRPAATSTYNGYYSTKSWQNEDWDSTSGKWTAGKSKEIADKNLKRSTYKKPSKTAKQVQTTLPLPSVTVPMEQVLVNDVRDLLLDSRMNATEKQVTDLQITALLERVGYSDIVDLVSMTEFQEIDEDTLIMCFSDTELAFIALYGDNTRPHKNKVEEDNRIQAMTLGYELDDNSNVVVYGKKA